ncbi:hypothetical protein BC828DRAFT_414127 [Blastocladiella britannica]|nr:hypothetical protein BC828DRAFT_414127 [Blastocladiella britannica]
MGFTYDPYNLKALDQAKGNVQGAVELIIGMGDPPAGAAAGSTPFTAPVRPAMDSRTVMRGAKVTISADAPAVRQLRNMGFTDLPVVMAALQKSDGDLDAAIVYMTDRADELRAYMAANPAAVAAAAFDQNAYAQQFMAQESQHQQYRAPSPAAPAAAAQPQQHQFSAPAAAPVAAAKPKSDLLDLFGELGGSDPFGAQQQPAMQPAGGLAFGGGMMMGGGGGFGAPVAAPAMGGYGGAQPPQFGMPQPQQQQMQLQSSPFGGPAGYGVPATAAAPASSSNPFGDFVSAPATAAPAQQQQPVRTGPAADIMALYGQQQQQQQQMAQRGMMPGGPFGGAGAPGMMMMGGGSGGFGGPTPNPFGAQMGGMGPGMPAQMGGAQMGGAQMGGMQMGGGGGGGVPNYSMASSPFGGGAAAQPRQPLPSGYIPGPGSAMSTSSPFGGAGSTFSSSSAAPAGAAADPFAGFGNVSAFSMGSTTSSAPSKAPSGSSTNPFM